MNATFERATRHLSDEIVSFGLICVSMGIDSIAFPCRLIAFFTVNSVAAFRGGAKGVYRTLAVMDVFVDE